MWDTANVCKGASLLNQFCCATAGEFWVQIEDRPVVKERVTVLREHRPVEREYVVRKEQGICSMSHDDCCTWCESMQHFAGTVLLHCFKLLPDYTSLHAMHALPAGASLRPKGQQDPSGKSPSLIQSYLGICGDVCVSCVSSGGDPCNRCGAAEGHRN